MSSLVYGIHAIDSLVNANQAKEIFILKKEKANPKVTKIAENAIASDVGVNYIENIKDLPFRIKRYHASRDFCD